MPARLSQKTLSNTVGGVKTACTGMQFGKVDSEAGTLRVKSHPPVMAGLVENDCVTSIRPSVELTDCTLRVWVCEALLGFLAVTVRPFTPTYGASALHGWLMFRRRRWLLLPLPVLDRLAMEPLSGARHVSLAGGAVSHSEFSAVESPAGAGVPSEVMAVAVVMFFITVLPATVTSVASSIAIPPPSWVEMLLTIWLFVMRIGSTPAIRSRTPPPSSFEMFDWMTLASIVTAPEPCVRPAATGRFGKFFGAGSWPAIMTPPPSSYEPLK